MCWVRVIFYHHSTIQYCLRCRKLTCSPIILVCIVSPLLLYLSLRPGRVVLDDPAGRTKGGDMAFAYIIANFDFMGHRMFDVLGINAGLSLTISYYAIHGEL